MAIAIQGLSAQSTNVQSNSIEVTVSPRASERVIFRSVGWDNVDTPADVTVVIRSAANDIADIGAMSETAIATLGAGYLEANIATITGEDLVVVLAETGMTTGRVHVTYDLVQ